MGSSTGSLPVKIPGPELAEGRAFVRRPLYFYTFVKVGGLGKMNQISVAGFFYFEYIISIKILTEDAQDKSSIRFKFIPKAILGFKTLGCC